jgi:hypothetical protein
MRTTLAALALTLLTVGPAMALEYRTPVAKQLFTCAATGLSRVALQAAPEPCCEGRLRCAQFLATGGVLKSMRDPRT